MSRSVLKARIKNQKKETAHKKSKQKRFIIAGILVLAVIAVIFFRIYQPVRHTDTEIYSDGHQTIRLFADGKFSAILAHNNQKNGTYTKTANGSTTAVLFIADGATSTGRVENNTLYFPHEWEDNHSHGNALPKVNAGSPSRSHDH